MENIQDILSNLEDMNILSSLESNGASDKFPNDPIFTQFARFSRIIPGVLISDEYGIDASYRYLLNDIRHLRSILRKQLPDDFFDSKGLFKPETGAITTITVSAYYFIVAFLAIAALGGKCAPLPTGVLPEEAFYFITKTNASYLLSEPNTADRAAAAKRHAQDVAGYNLHTISIPASGEDKSTSTEMEIDEDMRMSPTDPCLIIFTSGTTGKPKGVVLPRQRFYFQNQLDPDDIYLAYRAVHWVGGAVPLFTTVLQGGKLFFMKRPVGALAPELWEIFKQGRINVISLSPILYKALQEHYLGHIQSLPVDERDIYLAGLSKLRLVMNSGSALDPSTARFWRELVNLPIRNTYAATELGGAALMTSLDTPYSDGCIGKPLPGVEVKLSDGEHGEILVKSPKMFTHYIGDEDITKNSFDKEGFYRTGDIGRRVGDQYFFEGRASTDWIRFKHFKISIIELEQHLMKLPYISEAYVLPVLDYENKGLAAALIRLKKTKEEEMYLKIDLQRIRKDLSLTLELYKLPTLLRVLQPDDEVPQTDSGKPLKKAILEKYFQISGYRDRDYAVHEVEVWDDRTDPTLQRQAWDWEGEE